MRSLLCLLVVSSSVATAAEDATTIERTRVRQGVWVGPAIVRGSLSFEAPSARIQTRLDAIPALALGADLWPTPALGLHVAARIGAGADLGQPANAAKIGYNLHQLEAGARYRWYLGPRARAFALIGGLSLRGTVQTAVVQRPSFIVDRTALGPEVQAGFAWPIAGWRLWVRATVHAGLPFFVREGPTDSGDPNSFAAYGARLVAVIGLKGAWGLQISGDLYAIDLDFQGEGTRTGGVVGATTADRLLTAEVGLRYGF